MATRPGIGRGFGVHAEDRCGHTAPQTKGRGCGQTAPLHQWAGAIIQPRSGRHRPPGAPGAFDARRQPCRVRGPEVFVELRRAEPPLSVKHATPLVGLRRASHSLFLTRRLQIGLSVHAVDDRPPAVRVFWVLAHLRQRAFDRGIQRSLGHDGLIFHQSLTQFGQLQLV